MRGGKRKNSNSPGSKIMKAKEPKKCKQDGPETSSASRSSALAATPVIPVQPKAVSRTQSHDGKPAKPIFINENIQMVKSIITSSQLSVQPVCKIRGVKSTQVSCFNLDDKKRLISKLKSQSIAYHTFTDPADKPRCFVLKGFYHMSCADLLTLLNSSHLNAVKVTDLVRREEYVMYLVHFSSQTNINILNHNNHLIDSIQVKWENLKKSSNKVTQCFNCQSWGHSSINCGMPSRCVKCCESHVKGECPRTSRVGDPKCCNCGGNHTAIHRGCPVFRKHIEALEARKKKSPIARPPVIHPVPLNPSNFPALIQSQPDPLISNTVSFADKLKESKNANNFVEKLIQAREKLSSIPDLNTTLDILLKIANELQSCSDHLSRVLLITRYCIPCPDSQNGN